MGISNLLLKKELSELDQVSLRIPLTVISFADELAEALDSNRSEVLREMIIEGYKVLGHEWTNEVEISGGSDADS